MSLGINGHLHTYALDVLTRTKGLSSPPALNDNVYYVVGFVSDTVASASSYKQAFVACFQYNLNLSWVKYLPVNISLQPSEFDLFNVITEIKYQNVDRILVTGTVLELMYGPGTPDRTIANFCLDYNGNEVVHNFHLTNNTGSAGNNDKSVVADAVYDTTDNSVWLLSNEKLRNGVTMERLDLTAFQISQGNTARFYFNESTYVPYDSHGFKIFKDATDTLSIIGLFKRIAGGNNSYEVFTNEFSKSAFASTTNTYPVYHVSLKPSGFSGFNSYFDYTSNLASPSISPQAFVPNIGFWSYTSNCLMFASNTPHFILPSSNIDGYPNVLYNHIYPFQNNTTNCFGNSNYTIDTATNPINNTSSIPILDTLTNTNSIENDSSRIVVDVEDQNCAGNSFKTNGIAIKTNLTVEVFPNPVHTILKIKSENLERIQRLELISIEGRKRNYPIIQDGDKIAIDLTNLISGIYTLVFIDRENQIISRTKLIKE
ncbi:MAG: T9SS type A sorting domain-containing protein [Bacteroidetes bacterium]|nr:T9SS type A sorting domain-containing protein [Bacteroidota bacterium]